MDFKFDLLEDAVRVLSAASSPDAFGEERLDETRDLLEACSRESERLLSLTRETESDGDTGRTREDDSPQKVLERALAAHARDRYEEAEAILRRGLERFPGEVELLNHLALTYWERGDFEEAAAVYRRAMARALESAPADGVRPQLPRTYLRAMEGRALALYRLGRRRDALELFDALATARPSEYSGSRYLAGEIHHRAGDPEAALDHYRRAEAEPAVHYNRGLAHFQLGDEQRAVVSWIRGMVENSYIAAELTGVDDVIEARSEGYLGSANYAREFVRACEHLWSGADDALGLLETTARHSSVRSHLEDRRTRGGGARAGGLTGSERAKRTEGDEADLEGLARRVAAGGE
ncbi:MAG: tetratricopeptide repeat protein [Bradymonadaceae bacterium]